jgi:hypothetical protein
VFFCIQFIKKLIGFLPISIRESIFRWCFEPFLNNLTFVHAQCYLDPKIVRTHAQRSEPTFGKVFKKFELRSFQTTFQKVIIVHHSAFCSQSIRKTIRNANNLLLLKSNNLIISVLIKRDQIIFFLNHGLF